MKALTWPSRAAIRSRWACTTSTGETALVATRRASSPIEAHTSVVMRGASEHPVQHRGLDRIERGGGHLVDHGARGLHERQQRVELGVAEREALRLGERVKSVASQRRGCGFAHEAEDSESARA